MSVSLIAVAAIAASLLLTRKPTQERGAPGVPAGEQHPATGPSLDAIRAAGL